MDDGKDEILLQWEITPQQELKNLLILLPVIMGAFFVIFSDLFFSTKKGGVLSGEIIRNYLANGTVGIIMLSVLVFVFLFGLILPFAIIITFLKWGRKSFPEKYLITSEELVIISHNNVEKRFNWEEFKGFISNLGNTGEANIPVRQILLLKKNSLWPTLFPVSLRCNSDLYNQLYSLLKSRLPEKTESTSILIWIIVLMFSALFLTFLIYIGHLSYPRH